MRIILIKEGYPNVVWSKSGEYADTDNNIAKNYNSKNKKLEVIGSDGKPWLHIDKSFKDEFEYSHPSQSTEDATQVNATLNDLEDNYDGIIPTLNNIKDKFSVQESFIPSEVIAMVGNLTKIVTAMNTNMTSQIKELRDVQKENMQLSIELMKQNLSNNQHNNYNNTNNCEDVISGLNMTSYN